MIRAVLPAAYRPMQPESLVRLGRAHDGGYLVDARDVMSSDSLVSLGIYDDWSFDKAFVGRRDVPVFAYDGSVSGLEFVWRICRSVRDRHPRVLLKSAALLVDYFRFFSGRRRHVRSFVGSATLHPSLTLEEVLDGLREERLSRSFLKIDIEGSEYAILDQLIACAGATTGLAIEFHECHRHVEAISDFIARYPLRLVHIHANNFGTVMECGFPDALELTFSSSAPADGAPRLPHPLDMPNKQQREEIAIAFADA